MSDYDFTDDRFWTAAESANVLVLERIAADIKDELLSIEQDRVLRRADWDEFASVEHERSAYAQAKAEYSRWRADAMLRHRAVKQRHQQILRAMRDQVGASGGPTARTLIHRLTSAIARYESNETMPDEELYAILDKTFLVAQGQRMTLREFHAAGSRW